jgi:hypothetical protein
MFHGVSRCASDDSCFDATVDVTEVTSSGMLCYPPTAKVASGERCAENRFAVHCIPFGRYYDFPNFASTCRTVLERPSDCLALLLE